MMQRRCRCEVTHMSAEVKVSLAEVVLLPGEGAALEWQEPGV